MREPSSRRPDLQIDIPLINESDDPRDGRASPMGTTYREEGLSIGRDYLRFRGDADAPDAPEGRLPSKVYSLSPRSLRIESVVGRGSCSVVRRARHRTTDEPVALKMFPMRDKARRDMLVKELRALCGLQCDCLVGLVGAFFDRGEVNVTMVLEYMDRGSLEDLIRRQNDRRGPPESPSSLSQTALFPDRTSSAIAFQMLWGLSYLHFENMTHRDVKPANVLIHSGGQVKLSDFGIASAKKKGEEMNLTVVGTTRCERPRPSNRPAVARARPVPAVLSRAASPSSPVAVADMSPERLRAKPYGTSSDIWSLGLILIECAAGRSPFDGISSVVELVQTIEDSPTDQFVPSFVDDGLKELIHACLYKAPEKRVPAELLLSSPWFSEVHGLGCVDDSVESLRQFLDETAATDAP